MFLVSLWNTIKPKKLERLETEPEAKIIVNMLNNPIFPPSRKRALVQKLPRIRGRVSMCCLASWRDAELGCKAELGTQPSHKTQSLALLETPQNSTKLTKMTVHNTWDAFLQEPWQEGIWEEQRCYFPCLHKPPAPVTCTQVPDTDPTGSWQVRFFCFKFPPAESIGFGGRKPLALMAILTLKSATLSNLWVAFKWGQYHGRRADFHTMLLPVNSSLHCTEVYSHYEIQLGLVCSQRSLSDHRQERGKGTHWKRLKLGTPGKLMWFEFCGLITHKHATAESILSTSSAYERWK